MSVPAPQLCWQHENGTICPHPLAGGADGPVQCAGCAQHPAFCSCSPQEDGEVVGLSEDGTVIQWSADEQSLRDSCASVAEFGVYNLREHELARVGVDSATWAALRTKVAPLPYARQCAGAPSTPCASPNLGYLG